MTMQPARMREAFESVPTLPPPIAHIHRHPKFTAATIVTHQLPFPHTSHVDHVEDPSASSPKSASMSSAGQSTLVSHASHNSPGKGSPTRQPTREHDRHPRVHHDVEKGSRGAHRHGRPSTHSHPVPGGASYAYSKESQHHARALQERKAVKIMLFLSFPVLLLSFLNAIWTVISLVVTLLTQPVRLCARRPTFAQQLGGLLGPSLNLQLKSIYTPLPPHADEDSSYHTGPLVMIQLLSPFLSMGMIVAAWVVAVYWVSSAVVGDPAGLDKKDDSRETVLALRRWWERWLMRGIGED